MALSLGLNYNFCLEIVYTKSLRLNYGHFIKNLLNPLYDIAIFFCLVLRSQFSKNPLTILTFNYVVILTKDIKKENTLY